MDSKQTFTHVLPIIHPTAVEQRTGKTRAGRPAVLDRFFHWLKGEKTTALSPDPAAELIACIEDREVAAIVRDLHYQTPQSLKAMRMTCQECFVLPEDCPYYDYSIFDIKKAIRRLVVQPKHTHRQVVAELQKVNNELAYHLNEYLD